MKTPLDPRKIELLDETLAAALRGKSPAERLALGFEYNRTARLVIAGHLNTVHPQRTEQEVQAEVAGRMLFGAD
jgi:hypothetical protein